MNYPLFYAAGKVHQSHFNPANPGLISERVLIPNNPLSCRHHSKTFTSKYPSSPNDELHQPNWNTKPSMNISSTTTCSIESNQSFQVFVTPTQPKPPAAEAKIWTETNKSPVAKISAPNSSAVIPQELHLMNPKVQYQHQESSVLMSPLQVLKSCKSGIHLGIFQKPLLNNSRRPDNQYRYVDLSWRVVHPNLPSCQRCPVPVLAANDVKLL